MTKYLVTGGCGFIGTNLIIEILKNTQNFVVNIDKETYASNDILTRKFKNCQNYLHQKIDICEVNKLVNILKEFEPDYVIHLAAESHVDNSILSAEEFIRTNIIGTYGILEAAFKTYCNYTKQKKDNYKFIHVSTDEVYGSLCADQEPSKENDAYDTSSPYSASKAGSDHLVTAWAKTYGLPAIITHCSNNYGPYQHREKLIPKIIHNLLYQIKIPIYGNGQNIRDWIHVTDHVKAILRIVEEGAVGDTYNIGGLNQKTNIDIVKILIGIHINQNDISDLCLDKYVEFVKDRLGHDYRYSINCEKLINMTNWKPQIDLFTGLKATYKQFTESIN